MDACLKRTIAAGSVLVVLLCMLTVSASDAGSKSNPLITLGDLKGWFTTDVQADVSGMLGGTADLAMSRLDEIYNNQAGYSFAPRFTQISLASGGALALSTGGSFILLTGAASLETASGEVINVSTGSVVASGSPLNLYQRYFCAENTKARIKASSPVTGQVDGHYLMEGFSAPASTPDELPFLDVPESAWFFAAISFAYENELFKGTTETTFSPNTPMTRAMFVTVLHRLDGCPKASASVGFSDVDNPSQYYYDAVIWANANEIVAGYTDGSFQPDIDVTREQMAAIMHRYAAYKGRDISTPGAAFDTFPDISDISGYAAHAMRWAVSWEVIRGSGGRLLPLNTATRAEVAQIIYNYCEKIGW